MHSENQIVGIGWCTSLQRLPILQHEQKIWIEDFASFIANWKQIHTDLEVLKSHKRKIGEGLQDSIFVLQKTEKIEDMFDE